MTGKHRDIVFKSKQPYAVGTYLKLEKILKKGAYDPTVRVRAKKGYSDDVYILHSNKPQDYIGKLVAINKVEPGFMHYTYHLQPSTKK